jgi:hypothetical protein
MTLQRQVCAIALLLTTAVGAMGGLSTEEKQARLRSLRTKPARQTKLSTLDRAYLDATEVLTQRAPCSDFFGGEGAVLVLDRLVAQLREERAPNSNIGVRMSGAFTVFADDEKQTTYRLFAHAQLNTDGPFYRAKVFPADPFVPGVGSFRPNTRAARVLMLLHELAHLIRGRNGNWLIPDDGGNVPLSRQNTEQVEARCGEQIRNL